MRVERNSHRRQTNSLSGTKYFCERSPMRLERIAPKRAYDVEVKWTRPAALKTIKRDRSRHDRDAWLYMILGKRGRRSPVIMYIGQVFKNVVSRRLCCADHIRRCRVIQKAHPGHELSVSHGLIEMGRGRMTKNHLNAIERILTFAACESGACMVNQRNWYRCRTDQHYFIRNVHYKAQLPRELYYGVFKRW